MMLLVLFHYFSVEPPPSTYGIGSSNFIVNNTQPFIVGGKDAFHGEFPWQVSLQKNNFHFCGGSILDETHIITASHCTDGQLASNIEVVAGAHNIKDFNETTQQRVTTKRLVLNPKYNRRRINFDSSIVVLSHPLVFNEWVQPIKLAPQGHESSGKCVTSGWENANRLGLRPHVVPKVLQKVNMTIVTRGFCRIPYLFGARTWLTTSMICGGAGFLKGSCNGDSGSGLICYDLPGKADEPYLAGITSFGVHPCGRMLFPSVFANVANMRDFIDKEMGVV